MTEKTGRVDQKTAELLKRLNDTPDLTPTEDMIASVGVSLMALYAVVISDRPDDAMNVALLKGMQNLFASMERWLEERKPQ